MKFLNSTKLSIPSLSLSNFLKQASTWGEGGAWPILRRKPEPGWDWWNCAQSPSSWQAHPCPCPGRQRLSSPELMLEPCFLGRQGWCHLVDLLVDGVQLGDLRRPLFSSGKVVGLGHQLQHLHACEYRLGEVCIGEWELFWNFALQMLDCNKINYRLKLLHWIIDHTSKVLYISFLFCWSRKVHLGIGVNIFLDENLPVVGVARVVHQSALINVTLHQVGYQPPNPTLWSPWNLQNHKGRQLLCLQPIHMD